MANKRSKPEEVVMKPRQVENLGGPFHLVVGLGMGGIGAVRALDEAGENWLAVEAQGVPGGWSQSRTVSSYRLDYGPHIMLDFDDGLLSWMAMGKDIRFQEHCSESVFFCDHEGRPFPIKLPLSDNIAALPKAMLIDLPSDSPPNYASYLVECFGADIAARFLLPYDRKRLCVDLETLPPNWNRRVLPAGRSGVGESSYLYPADSGIGVLSEHLLKDLNQDRLRYRTSLLRLSLERKEALLSDGSTVRFKSLYSSLPLPDLLNLLEERPFCSDEIRDALPYASSDITYLALRESWTKCYDFARFAMPSVPFHRLAVLSAYSNHCCPPDETLLMLETNRAPGLPSNKSANPKRMVDQLIDLGLFSPDVELAFYDKAFVEHSAIITNAKTPNFVSRVSDILTASDICLIGKFGSWEDMLMGRALRSGVSAVQQRLFVGKK